MPRSRAFKYIVVSLLFALFSGCSGMKPEMFEGTTPRFVLEDYFRGKTRAWGLVHDRSGKLIRQFTVDITGEWDGTVLTLTEDFVYSDGAKEQRVWQIKKIDEHRYEGRAGDVVGVAEGLLYGQALNWSYDIDLKVDDGTVRVHFNDWMYLMPDNMLANRAVMTKFGFMVGEVMIFFRKDI